MHNLSQHVDVREIGAPVGAGSSIDNNSDRIDMSGYDGALFIATVTDSVANGVATLTIEQNDSDSDSGMSALSGAVATVTSEENDDLNNGIMILDIHRPKKRYIQAVRTSSTQNIAYGNLIVVLYKGKKMPPSNHSSVLASTTVVSPDES